MNYCKYVFFKLYSLSFSRERPPVERRLRHVLQPTLRGGEPLQGHLEERPPLPAVHPSVRQQPAAEEEGRGRVHPLRYDADHQVPAAHRAARQDGQGPPHRAGQAQGRLRLRAGEFVQLCLRRYLHVISSEGIYISLRTVCLSLKYKYHYYFTLIKSLIWET